MKFIALITRLATLACVLLPTLGHAQSHWPDRAVKFIVPFPAGQGADILCRLVTNELGQRLGQAVIIENRPGAGSNIGNAAAARATPDGYTFLCTGAAIAVNQTLYRQLSYDVTKDFSGVTVFAQVPMVILSTPSSGIKSVADLIAQAKANPGKLNYGVASVGGSPHLAVETLKLLTGTDIVHVPYTGSAQAQQDFLGDRFTVFVDGLITTRPLIESKKAVPLAVISGERSPLFPDLPTVRELGIAGLQDYDFSTWLGALAPKGTPSEALTRLQREIGDIMKGPEMVKAFRERGTEPSNIAGAEMDRFVANEVKKWAPSVKATGLSLE